MGMKKTYILTMTLFAMIISVVSVGCNPDYGPVDPATEIPAKDTTQKPVPLPDPEPTPDPLPQPGNRLQITIGTASFTATLADNATAAAFRELLPMTISMNEMNGNEKYYYLSGNLPTGATSPVRIQSGDLMLYGSNCFVLFYESFQTSYSYTRIGSLDNPAGLAAALGSGSVSVRLELK